MTNQWQISIRSKILMVLSAVVIAAVALYLALASKLFFEDKTLLVYELNQANVRNLGQDAETYLKGILLKLQIMALAQAKESAGGENDPIIDLVVPEDEGFFRVGVISNSGKSRILREWPKALEFYSQSASFLDRVREANPIPLDQVIKNGVWIRNVTLPMDSTIPMMTIAARMASGEGVIYVDMKPDHLLDAFSRTGIAETYLVDSAGGALAHSDQSRVQKVESLLSDPLVQAANGSKLRSEVRRFAIGEKGFLGSFYRLGVGGLIVGSRIWEGEAFAAVKVLVQKSFVYGLVVITVAFLVGLFFSHSLTVPIRRLVDATHRLAQGDFSRKVLISSRDELALLAESFNTMTEDLSVSRKKIEEHSRDLENKVAERTAKLEAQKIMIQQAQEAIVRTTRLASVGEVAGQAAHEVLNPLTSITTRLEKIKHQLASEEAADNHLLSEIAAGWNKTLKDKGASALFAELSSPSAVHSEKILLQEDLENLGSIAKDLEKRLVARNGDVDFLLKESMRISKIVNGMRQLSRVSGSQKSVSVHSLISDTIATIDDILKRNKIQVDLFPCEASPMILVDPDEMLQVLSNLIRNSIQAFGNTQGRIQEKKIRISTERTGGRVRIRVADNGPGVAPENFSKIFEPTFSTKSIQEGTGLGLAICRRFVRAYDGEITLERSEPDNETSFLIELPENGGMA